MPATRTNQITPERSGRSACMGLEGISICVGPWSPGLEPSRTDRSGDPDLAGALGEPRRLRGSGLRVGSRQRLTASRAAVEAGPVGHREVHEAAAGAVHIGHGSPLSALDSAILPSMAFTLTLLGAMLAVALELLEALAIVLAVAVSRRPRDAVIGAAAAVVVCSLAAALLGPVLVSRL